MSRVNSIEDGQPYYCSVEGAMATATLGQYFRSFMVKLGMIESQLAELPRDGVQPH